MKIGNSGINCQTIKRTSFYRFNNTRKPAMRNCRVRVNGNHNKVIVTFTNVKRFFYYYLFDFVILC